MFLFKIFHLNLGQYVVLQKYIAFFFLENKSKQNS